jgi:hypothetical protein
MLVAMRRGAASRVVRRASVGLLLLAGCEFAIADWYYVDRPRAMGTRAEVVALGPVWPERVGFDPLDPPITEPMPGDTLRLEPMIVDAEGRAIDPETIDALWFQCGTARCVHEDGWLPPWLDEPCSLLPEWTMDHACKLGSGGALEFVVPPVGQLTVFTRYSYYYMVAAVDDSQTAESCWAARKDSDEPLDGCVFADRELKIGPSWPLLVLAALEGLEQDIPVFEIPAPAFLQPSNRIPVLGPIAMTGADPSMSTIISGTEPVPVRPGQRFTLTKSDWRPLYDLQAYFTARETPTSGSYVFLPAVEIVWIEWYTSGSLVRLDPGNFEGIVELLIDEQAKPGTTSRLIVLWGDDRGAQDMRVIEFEVGE